jgi:hypothetical protein
MKMQIGNSLTQTTEKYPEDEGDSLKTIYKTIWHHNPEDCSRQTIQSLKRSEKRKS